MIRRAASSNGETDGMIKNPLVSVIILNWNGKTLIEDCLSSVSGLHYAPVEIIVVDNNSTDGSEKFLEAQQNILLLRNPTNLGYAGGNNAGFKAAKGKYCAVLNNDMIVDKAWLDDPVRILEAHDEVGIISCRQMNYWERGLIDGLYHKMEKTLKTGVVGEDERYADRQEYSLAGYVLSANGGSMVMRKALVEQLGGFDERLFAYGEDVDFCFRAFLRSKKCCYVPGAVVFHKGSASFGKNPGRKIFYEWRNRYFLLYKFFPWRIITKHLYWILWNEWRTIGHVFFKKKKPFLYLSIWIAILSGIGKFRKERSGYCQAFFIKEPEWRSFLRCPIHVSRL